MADNEQQATEQFSNEILKKVIRDLHSLVVGSINASSVIDRLFSANVISHDDLEELDLVKRTEKCRRLLIMLHRTENPRAFIELRKAIKGADEKNWLVEKIDEQHKLMELATAKPKVTGEESTVTPLNGAGPNQLIDDLRKEISRLLEEGAGMKTENERLCIERSAYEKNLVNIVDELTAKMFEQIKKSRMRLTAIEKSRLRENHLTLVNALDFENTKILDYLYCDGILSAGDIAEIERKSSASERANFFLLNVIPKKQGAFEKFVRALVKENQTEAAKLLDPELTKQFIDDSKNTSPVTHGTRSAMLRDNHLYLISNLDFRLYTLCSNLLERELLTIEDLKTIESQSVVWRKARHFLLTIWPTRGQTGHDEFLEALRETKGQEYVFEELQRYLTSPRGMDSRKVQQEYLSAEDIIHLLQDPSVRACQPIASVTKEDAAKLLKQGAYQMHSKVRGRAIIINNRYFISPTFANRHSSKYDVLELEDLFTRLQFEVITYLDAFAEEIVNYVRKETEEIDHENYDAFVLFIMSHGLNGYVVGSDGKNVKVDDIVNKVGSCWTLHHKPKMIFIQADRTNDNDGDFKTETFAEPSPNEFDAQIAKTFYELKYGRRSNIINYKDIIIANSTISGFHSFRNQHFGSFFVRYFVYICSTRAHEEDLSSMLTTVNELLNKRRDSVGLNIEQVGESVSRLCKKLYFLPDYFTSEMGSNLVDVPGIGLSKIID